MQIQMAQCAWVFLATTGREYHFQPSHYTTDWRKIEDLSCSLEAYLEDVMGYIWKLLYAGHFGEEAALAET